MQVSQRRFRGNSSAGGVPPTQAPKAIAYAGGGFRALSVDIGLTTALLAAKARRDNVSATFAGAKLWDRFGIVSSVSGSTWFLASLAFSRRFQDMIERMAAAPRSAGLEFHNDWMKAWISIGRGKRNGTDNDDLVGLFGEASGGATESLLQQNLRELSFFWRRGMSWNDYVHQLLKTTTHLDSHHSLGDPVEPWLAGKAWLVCHSVVVGSEEKQAHVTRGLGTHVRYALTRGGPDVPVYLPAKYSVVLGSGPDADAPYPFIAQGLVPARRIEYVGSAAFGARRIREYSELLEDLWVKAARRVGSVPIVGPVSASSAFIGGLCLSRTLSAAQDLVGSQMTPFAALSADAAETFHVATSSYHALDDKGVSRGRLRMAARAGVVATVDGHYTDDSGIAQDQHKMQLSQGRAFLQDIATFTLRGTTVDSELFGIRAGRNVTLRVFFVTTTLSIGVADDYVSYCTFVQEMVESLLAEENLDRVEKWLLEYF